MHKTTWTSSSGLQPFAIRKVLYPDAMSPLPRGGYGVTGIEVADILGNADDELIVGTLGGEIVILDEDLQNVLWRANVPGAVGCYNSIRVEEDNGQKYLYVSGSFGIWRFSP